MAIAPAVAFQKDGRYFRVRLNVLATHFASRPREVRKGPKLDAWSSLVFNNGVSNRRHGRIGHFLPLSGIKHRIQTHYTDHDPVTPRVPQRELEVATVQVPAVYRRPGSEAVDHGQRLVATPKRARTNRGMSYSDFRSCLQQTLGLPQKKKSFPQHGH